MTTTAHLQGLINSATLNGRPEVADALRSVQDVHTAEEQEREASRAAIGIIIDQLRKQCFDQSQTIRYVTKELIKTGVDCGAAPVEELARRVVATYQKA